MTQAGNFEEDSKNFDELHNFALLWLEALENDSRAKDAEIRRLEKIEQTFLQAKTKASELAALLKGE